ncbi:hypothetical protein IQ215_03840 [Cyanobacterium stanieri LEGE 03274]|uniref:DUF5723 domain-containing protein n=1 Tax=Cyanobacterium stanieri LEGE 03274 TaxID=1828756 RepID=A0ABR9V1Q3_9CHRO|nr:hypothetical protein [Cyanobacterium stanieri]MBE9221820.1 hypothetical protein [Cyanobacterium stanieri LEGE 03274]
MLKKSLWQCSWFVAPIIVVSASASQALETQINFSESDSNNYTLMITNLLDNNFTFDVDQPLIQSKTLPTLNPVILGEYNHNHITVIQRVDNSSFGHGELMMDQDFLGNDNKLVAQSASDLEMEEVRPSNNSWHFLIQPSIYVPFTIYGDAAAGSVSGDFSLDASQIRRSIKDDLNFAFFGRMKAWNPEYRWGVFADFDYLSLDSRASISRRLPPSLGSIPVRLDASADSKLWSLSLGGAYRFYDRSKVNPDGVETEFDLGRSVFDVFGGVNITGVDLGLNFSSPGLGQARFNGNTTVVSPIIGARARVNLSPQWAWVTGGSFSGFGIDGLNQWNLGTGLDWKFSEGKTSLGFGYRFGYTSYGSNLTRATDFEVNVNQNGPYVNVSFRF